MSYQEILSVGIDIGTSTTQTIFSKLRMRNTAGYFAVPKIDIVQKSTVYKSAVHLTPMLSRTLLDAAGVKILVQADFADAGFSPKDTATGAVIITGEAARKQNAAAVLQELSSFAGDFVVATAGPDLEAVIAGKGSGAYQYSIDNACTAVNMDIGGGTANIVLFDNGRTLAKGCLDIGGRQVCIDASGAISYVSDSAAKIAQSQNIDIKVSQKADIATLTRLCDIMAELLEDILLGKQTSLLQSVTTNSSTLYCPNILPTAIFFSGGVADCIFAYYDNPFEFGDIGVLLGRAIRERSFFNNYAVINGTETIRATVVGAGSYTTAVSGSTIFYSSSLFPLKNLPVYKLSQDQQQACTSGRWDTLASQLQGFVKELDADNIILCLKGEQDPDYQSVKRLAASIASACDSVYPQAAPIVVAIEADIAKALGQNIHSILEGRREVLVIDTVAPESGDYIDIGYPLLNGLAVPVVVKSLIIGS